VNERLYENQEVVFASATHRLAKRENVSVADLAGERWTSTVSTSRAPWQALLEAFKSKGLLPPPVALHTNSQAVRMQAIAYSDYIGVNTRHFVRQEPRKFPLIELRVKEMRVTRDLSIIARKGAYVSPAARRLIDILKQQAKKAP
jgi:DNA-binding transcriptional LysR family regulator